MSFGRGVMRVAKGKLRINLTLPEDMVREIRARAGERAVDHPIGTSKVAEEIIRLGLAALAKGDRAAS